MKSNQIKITRALFVLYVCQNENTIDIWRQDSKSLVLVPRAVGFISVRFEIITLIINDQWIEIIGTVICLKLCARYQCIEKLLINEIKVYINSSSETFFNSWSDRKMGQRTHDFSITLSLNDFFELLCRRYSTCV